jgi:hypothetical protein
VCRFESSAGGAGGDGDKRVEGHALRAPNSSREKLLPLVYFLISLYFYLITDQG